MMKSGKLRAARYLFAAVTVYVIYSLFCPPVPEGLTVHVLDRFVVMPLFQPVLSILYYYPVTYFCPSADCRVWWMRIIFNSITRLADPRIMFDSDPLLHLSTRNFNGVKVRTYIPVGNRTSRGAVVYIHGGGFAIGSTQEFEGLMRKFTKRVGTVVISVEYRLAPETPFPGGLEDCETALEYFLQHAAKEYDVDPNKVIIMGDSAGGNLAAVIAQRRQIKNPSPALAGQVLLYPLLHFGDFQAKSFRFYNNEHLGIAIVDSVALSYYMLWYAGIDVSTSQSVLHAALSNSHIGENTRREIEGIVDWSLIPSTLTLDESVLVPRQNASHHLQSTSLLERFLLNPDVSPLMRRNLSGLPASLVVTCEYDVLRDEGILYAERLRLDNVPTKLLHYKHGHHAMFNLHNELYIANDALWDVVKWVQRVLT